jgi:hypothetical protein
LLAFCEQSGDVEGFHVVARFTGGGVFGAGRVEPSVFTHFVRDEREQAREVGDDDGLLAR